VLSSDLDNPRALATYAADATIHTRTRRFEIETTPDVPIGRVSRADKGALLSARSGALLIGTSGTRR
jgi:hypothetical protein